MMSRDVRRRQHSHDSGFHADDSKYVTVVSVNGGLVGDRKAEELIAEGDFVTVLSIGDVDDADRSICLNIQRESGFVEEVSVVERRVAQKLGFGLKFDGGSEGGSVRRLFIQCCAEGSPAAAIRCSWGALVEADEIVAICQQPVPKMSRIQIIHQLTEGPPVIQLKIRHFWLL